MGKDGIRHLMAAAPRALKLRRALARPELTDDEREALAREFFRDLPPSLGDLPEPAVSLIINHFVQMIVQGDASASST
jgi:hypothetical protein